MMEQHSAHKALWQSSDFMIAITLATGVALDYFVADIWEPVLPPALYLSLGISLVLIGIIIIALAKKEFKKEQQPSAPGKPTTKIVTSGIFNYSRNPLYVGIVVTVAGIGFLFNNFWIFVLDAPLVMAIHTLLILPEEDYLLRNFGDEYLLYMNKVRRWL